MKISKTVTTILFGVMVVFVLLCCCNQVQAAREGDYTYTITDGKAEITDYTGAGGAVTIPDTLGGAAVTSIGNFAFCDCSGLTSIAIPQSVSSIGDYAFYGCSELPSITIPQGVTSIGDFAYGFCPKLANIMVDPNNSTYTSIGGMLFNKDATALLVCPCGLNSITIPQSAISIGMGAFNGCSGLTTIFIPQGVTSICSVAFGGCSKLANIVVDPNNSSYTSIGGVLFNKAGTTLLVCPGGLTSITIPQRVISIDMGAFLGCSGLTNLTIPQGVTSIGIGAFLGCSGLTNLTIPQGVTRIEEYSFFGCSGLTSIIIPQGVTSIGPSAFGGCSRLTSITIPQGVTSIGDEAFLGCKALTNLTIPQGVDSIGAEAFYECLSLSTIIFKSSTTIIFEESFTINLDTKIIGYDPSTAKDYATKYYRLFESLGPPPASLQGIAITTPAAKLTYTVGDELDITGLVVTGTYSDNTSAIQTITTDNITGFNSTAPAADQVLTINVFGKTASYKIQINKASSKVDECFIATAAFGSKFTWPVALLRHFRDQYLLTNVWGTAFVDFYYRHSPPIAAIIAGSGALKTLVRVLLAPIIATVYLIYHPLLFITFLIISALFVSYVTRQNRYSSV